MSTVLVTGGAGYVGSHAVKVLAAAGFEVVVLDSLVNGHREAVSEHVLVEADVSDTAVVRETIRRHAVTDVLHFAAFLSVGESVQAPARYYDNNVRKTLALLESVVEESVRRFVFSSTAAVYGTPRDVPIVEDHPTRPINAYGQTKLAIEHALPHYETAYGLRYTCLRYFNAAGADPSGELGEDHRPEIHLIPLALAAAAGARPPLEIFGDDYPTADGTCERDYVHVTDLAQAHVLALGRLAAGAQSTSYNLANGRAYSVRDVLDSVERVVGQPVPCHVVGRRSGDPAVLVASSQRAREELGWAPRFEAIDDIVRTAWQWHRTHPAGYRSRP